MWADYVTAAVRTGPPESGAEGLSVLVIPLKNTKGVTVRRMHVSGLNASGSTFIIFNDVLVPKENLIGRLNEGFKIIMSNFNSERLLLAVGALSMARTCYSEAFKHATRRKTFGKPLMGNQIIRSKFASMVRSIETCDAWVEQLAWQMKTMGVANPSAGRGIGARIALAKVQAGKVRFVSVFGVVPFLIELDVGTLLQRGATNLWRDGYDKRRPWEGGGTD